MVGVRAGWGIAETEGGGGGVGSSVALIGHGRGRGWKKGPSYVGCMMKAK